MTKNDSSNREDTWLTDFADSILDGEADSPPAAAPNAEALTLAESLLRLKRAFPKQELDSATVKRMRADVLEKWRAKERKRLRWPQIFRLNWLTPARRPQTAMAFAMLVLAGILIVSAPVLFSNSGSLIAAAGTNIPGAAIWLALVALLVALFLLLRRKS
ncbi:MAG: hypothetical protein HY867_20095 [Chloroflexi bacterium]|nr:hypothetical protein [Chloroflexota bacterium]